MCDKRKNRKHECVLGNEQFRLGYLCALYRLVLEHLFVDVNMDVPSVYTLTMTIFGLLHKLQQQSLCWRKAFDRDVKNWRLGRVQFLWRICSGMCSSATWACRW